MSDKIRERIGRGSNPDEKMGDGPSVRDSQDLIRELRLRQIALEEENAQLRERLSRAEAAAGTDRGGRTESELRQTNEYLENIFENLSRCHRHCGPPRKAHQVE